MFKGKSVLAQMNFWLGLTLAVDGHGAIEFAQTASFCCLSSRAVTLQTNVSYLIPSQTGYMVSLLRCVLAVNICSNDLSIC